MLVCCNYNTLGHGKASYWLIFELGRLTPLKISLSFKWPVRRFKLKAEGRYVRFYSLIGRL